MKLKIRCNACKVISLQEFSSGEKGKLIPFHCPSCAHESSVRLPNNQSREGVTNVIEKNLKKLVGINLKVKNNEYHKAIDINLKKAGEFLVGRKSVSQPCDVEIQTSDRTISRRHFKLNISKTASQSLEVFLQDNNSTNGLYLNEEKLNQTDQVFLYNGDVIKCGKSEIEFNFEEEK